MISMREENLRERKKQRRACVRRLRMLLVLFSIFFNCLYGVFLFSAEADAGGCSYSFSAQFPVSQCRFAGMACGDSYAVELPQAGEAVISDAVSCKSLYAV